jgi:hypothetical protein
MISAATQSTAKTIAGQRYILAIDNGSAQGASVYTTFILSLGHGYSFFATETWPEGVYWGAGETRHVTFTAWGDGIRIDNHSADLLWRLIPLGP